MRRVAVCLCAAIACSGVVATPAAPAPGLRSASATTPGSSSAPGRCAERAPRLRELGVEVARVTFDWRRIEPQQGAFDWTRADAWLEALRAQGIEPLVALWGTPRLGKRRRRPERAAAFGGDVRAVRAGGGGAIPVGSALGRLERAEPAALAAAAVADGVRHEAAQSRRRRDQVRRSRRHPSRAARRRLAADAAGTSPVDFIRGMGRAGARLDAYAHHPHSLSPAETPTSGGCAQCSTITMATLERLLRETRAAFGPRTRVWLTELGYQTNPPDRVLGVSWARQARFVAEAQRRAYVASRVDLLVQYLVRDEPRLDAWQSGLETVAGRAKPALAAFSLPLAQVGRQGVATTVWGQVRPGTGRAATCSSASSTGAGRLSAAARRRAGDTSPVSSEQGRAPSSGCSTRRRGGWARHSSCSDRITPTRRVHRDEREPDTDEL